jgi:hypothetical protein
MAEPTVGLEGGLFLNAGTAAAQATTRYSPADDLPSSFKAWQESTSPSGRHLGYCHSIMLEPPLDDDDTTRASAAQLGSTPLLGWESVCFQGLVQ